MKTAMFLAAALLLAGVAGAQSDVDNMMTMFFDPEEFVDENTNIDPGNTVFQAYIVLLNSTVLSVGGYELGITLSDPSLVVLDATGPNGWTNFGSVLNHLAGYGAPLPAPSSGVVLATLTLLHYGSGLVEIHFGNAFPPSFPDIEVPVIADGENPDTLLLCTLPTADGLVATINGPGIHIPSVFVPLAIGVAVAADGDNLAATAAEATDGFDPGLDRHAPAGSILHFTHPEWTPPDSLDHDVRPLFDPFVQAKTWTLEVVTVVENPYEPETVVITFAPDFAESDGIGLRLYDHLAGVSVSLWPGLTYTYTANIDETRTFALLVGASVVPEHVSVGIFGRVGYLRDNDNLALTLDGATDGWDALYDYPEPAPPPEYFLSVNFYHPDWPLGPRFQTDARAPYDAVHDQRIWPLRLETDQAGPVILRFSPNFTINDGIGLVLHDPGTAQTINLLPSLSCQIEMLEPIHDLELRVGGVNPPTLDPLAREVAAGWSLIGLPLQPPPGANLADVVLDDCPGPAYLYILNDVGAYESRGGTAPPSRHTGYWLGATAAFTWDMPGTVDLTPIVVPARLGWNLVGNPLWFPASLGGLQLRRGGVTLSWNDAVAAGWTSASVYSYITAAGDYAPVTSLRSWHGYWVRSYLEDLEFVFDWRVFQAAAALAGVAGAPDLPDALDWSIELALRAPDGPVRKVRCGVHPEATPGYDSRHDQPEPPRSPAGGGLRFCSEHPEFAAGLDRSYRQDLTAPDVSEFAWDLRLETDTPGRYLLTWERHDWPPDHDLQLYRPDQNRVVVASLREQGSLAVDLGQTPVVLRLRTPDAWSSAPETVGPIDRLVAAPNPLNPATGLALDLARGGEVRVAIHDVRGRRVAELALGQLAAGRHTVSWQARDGAGRELASGVYFATLIRDGKRVGGITKLDVVR